MASYLPSITDTPVNDAVYQPDFSFLAANQQKKEQQYQQGLSEVAQGYSAITNAPVTGDKANEVKNQYRKTAEDGLKKISASDLSLPKNVAQAEALYSPFWKDQDLLTNIALTKYYNNEDGKLDQWENSTDKDTKALYSDEARTYLQIKRKELADAPFSASAYNRLDKGQATPFYDMEADISKLYKEEGNKGIDNVSVIGDGVYTSHNGVKSLDSFRNYALSKLGPKYNPQLRVSAYVSMYGDKQKALAENSMATPDQVNEHFAVSNIHALADGYLTNKRSYDNIASYWDKRATQLLSETKGGKTASPDQRDKILFYQDQAKAHREQSAHYENEYIKIGGTDNGLDVNSDNYKNQLRGISTNPEQYIADINRQRAADSWATGMAYMNTGEDIKLNPVIAEYNRHSEKQAELAIQQRGVDATNYATTAKMFEATGMTTPGGKQDPRFNSPGSAIEPRTSGFKADFPTGTGTGTGTNLGPTAWTPQGMGTTAVAKLPTDYVQHVQEQIRSDITNDVYSTTGLANSLVLSGAIKPEELPNLKEWSDNAISGTRPTSQQAATLAKVVQAMKDKGIDMSGVHGPQGMQNALIAYTTKVGDDLLKTTVGDNLPQLHAQGAQIVSTAARMQQRMSQYNQNQQNYDKAEHDLLISNGKYTKLRVQDPGTGQLRQINENDLIPYLKNMHLHSTDGTEVDLKALAQGYLSGKLNPVTGGTNQPADGFEVNGKQYITAYRYDQFAPDPIQEFINKFGTSEEHNKLKQEASIEVNKSLETTKNGLVFPRYGIDPSDPNTKEIAERAAKEIASPSIAPIAYKDEAIQGNEISAKETDFLRTMIQNADKAKKYVSHIGKTNTPEGLPAYEVDIDPTAKDSNGDKVFAHDKYILPVASLENAPILASIPNKQNFLYSELYRVNTPVTAPPIMKSYGQDYTIRGIKPDGKGTATAAYVVMRHSLPDKDHPGQFLPIEPEVYEIPYNGPTGKNSEEIVNFANNKAQQYIGATTTILKEIQQRSASDNIYKAPIQDIQKYGK